eukprot:536474-Prorocentrum_minimum.AAC.1
MALSASTGWWVRMLSIRTREHSVTARTNVLGPAANTLSLPYVSTNVHRARAGRWKRDAKMSRATTKLTQNPLSTRVLSEFLQDGCVGHVCVPLPSSGTRARRQEVASGGSFSHPSRPRPPLF